MPSNREIDTAEIWLSALRAAGRSAKTIETYAHAVRQFREWRTVGDGLESVTKLEARAFVRHLLDTFTPGGARVRQVSLRAFYGWLVAEEMVALNPFAGIRISVPEVAQSTASDEQIEAMLASAKRSKRDLAMLTLLVDTGARRREISSLEMGDVDLSSGVVNIRVSKSRARSVPLSDRCVVALARWLRQRGVASGRLWNSVDPYTLINAVCLRHSGGKLRCHALRRAFAVRWLERGGSEVGLMRVAGWSSLEMVKKYTAASADRLAAEEFRRLMA